MDDKEGDSRVSHHHDADSTAGVALRLRFRLEAALFDVFAAAVSVTSPRGRLALGSAFGTLFWLLAVRLRRLASANVRLAYGEAVAPREVRRIVLGSMRHFARIAVETLAFPKYPTDSLAAHVRVEGLEHLRGALARGKGVIGFTGHLGHWELLAYTLARAGIPATGISRPLDNPHLERRLLRLRTLSGNRIISKRGAFPEAVRVLEEGGFLGIWIDQRPKRGGVTISFFGRQTRARSTVAVLALRTGAAIVPIFSVLEPDGLWRVVVEPEVRVGPTGDPEADTRRMTAETTAVLERWVRRYPEQWLWTHARWTPPASAGS